MVSADGSPGGPSVARRARSRLLAALVFAALVVLSQSASAQGSEAEEAVQEDTAAAEAVQEDTAATQADVDSGAGEVPPAEPPARTDLPVSNAEDDPAAAAGPSDPVDTVAPSPGDPAEAPSVPADVPEATPVADDTGSAPPVVESPIAASEGASQAEPADATAAPEAPAIAPPPVPAEPLAPAPSQLLKASQDDLRVPGGALWRAIPLVRLGTAEAQSPALPSVALLGSAPAPRPTSGVAAAAGEEPPPRPALAGPDSRGSPSTPDAFVCGSSSACAGGFPPSVLILFTALACLCTLLFERLVVAFSSWRSESFVSLRERPG